MATKTQPLPDLAIPPGELLAEELEARGLTPRQLADAMGRSPQAVRALIHGKRALSAQLALELEQALGIDAQIWLGLESRYRLILARQSRRSA